MSRMTTLQVNPNAGYEPTVLRVLFDARRGRSSKNFLPVPARVARVSNVAAKIPYRNMVAQLGETLLCADADVAMASIGSYKRRIGGRYPRGVP